MWGDPITTKTQVPGKIPILQVWKKFEPLQGGHPASSKWSYNPYRTKNGYIIRTNDEVLISTYSMGRS